MLASSPHARDLSSGLTISYPPEEGEGQRVSSFAGAAMQPYSWTNNRQPVFWHALPGRFSTGF